MNVQLEEPDRAEVVEVLSRLVAAPSVNPLGADVAEAPFGEGRVAEIVEDYLGALGVTSERQEVFPGRFNVVGKLEPCGFRKTLILEVHMDTCKVEGMSIAPFDPKVEDGKLFGRGACDTKGSLAAMLMGLKMLCTRRESLRTRVILLATVDEEFSYAGVKQFVNEGGRGDLAIVGEPTRLNLVVAHKGGVRWRIITHGKAAHSSQPELGSNAIYKMARVVRAIEEKVIPLYSKRVHPLLGNPTISVGTIEGGQQTNVVPERCAISIDRRLLPKEDPKEAMAEVNETVAQAFGEGWESELEFEEASLIDFALDGSPDDACTRFVASAARKVLPELQVVGVHYGTDASKLALGGIPSLVFGPGDIAQAHSAVEFVAIEEVVKAAQVYAQVALDMQAQPTAPAPVCSVISSGPSKGRGGRCAGAVPGAGLRL